MADRRRRPGRAWAGPFLAAGLALVLACAQPGAPPGGPEDVTPPVLAAVQPESGAVGLRDVTELRFTFSEKMDRRPADQWLVLYPRVAVNKTSWQAARTAVVELQEPLPPDTVVVVELRPGMADMHRVKNPRGRRFPVATTDTLPSGSLGGTLVFEDKPLAQGVVELYAVPPDTVRWFQQDVLRRTETDSTGRWRLRWLAVPSGPYLVRAFVDRDGDLRMRESDPQRLLPDTMRVARDDPRVDVGVVTIYAPTTPGTLRGVVDSALADRGPVLGWVEAIAEDDTGWAPEPQLAAPSSLRPVEPGSETEFERAGPGPVRLILFADQDGDSLFSVMPADTAVAGAPVDSAGRPARWWFEPHAMADSIQVEPGLEADFRSPDAWRLRVPWFGEAPRDTTLEAGAAAADTSAAVPGGVAAPADTLNAAPADTTALEEPTPREQREP
ncbi:MAG: Ig-like domain-containing protein [Candidatus Krumholzibacteriia bacterium]